MTEPTPSDTTSENMPSSATAASTENQEPVDSSPATESNDSTVGMTGLPGNVAAGLAALVPLVGGLVVFLIEKKDGFVRFHAMQSIYFGVAIFVINIVLMVVGVVLSVIPFLGAFLALLLGAGFWLASFVLWLLGVVKAFSGENWEMPVIGKMVRAQLNKVS